MSQHPKRNSPYLDDLLRQKWAVFQVHGQSKQADHLDLCIAIERARCVRAEGLNAPIDLSNEELNDWDHRIDPPLPCHSEHVPALASLPRLADGAIAYPGRIIWELRTVNGGRTWFPVQIAIGEVDCHKHIRFLGCDSWIANPDVRHYGTKEAALADIPNHTVKPVYEVVACSRHIGEWLAELIDSGEGKIFTARFTGPDSEERARAYAEWKNA